MTSFVVPMIWPFCVAVQVVMVIYAVYIYMSDDNVLDPDKAFVTSSLVNVLNFPLSWLPAGVAYCGQVGIRYNKRNDKYIYTEVRY